MSDQFKTKLLFEKYLNNACTAKELEELFELLKNESNILTIEDDLEKLWHKTNVPETNAANINIFQKIQEKINSDKSNYHYKKDNGSGYKWLAAACITFLFLGAYFYNSSKLVIKTERQYLAGKKSKQHNRTVKRIELADGSIVVLNKGSELKYPKEFTENTRTVYLTGEAYFDIKHDENRPFLVHTGKLITRVLGTAFNIKTQNNENLIKVTVTRGKVAVSNNTKTLVVLLPNQQINYNQKLDVYQKKEVNAQISTLWKEDDLVLNNVTLADAIKQIETRYATKILLSNDEIKKYQFTAYFLNTSDLPQVIKVIADLNHLSYQINNDGQYILSPNKN